MYMQAVTFSQLTDILVPLKHYADIIVIKS